jgi:hypothetical protein
MLIFGIKPPKVPMPFVSSPWAQITAVAGLKMRKN